MNSSKDPGNNLQGSDSDDTGSPAKRIKVDEVLRDLRAGMRTQEFLSRHAITMAQFEELLKRLIRQGLFTKEDFRAWKANRPAAGQAPARSTLEPDTEAAGGDSAPENVATWVLKEPEKNHAWALQLFSTKREEMRGAKFKVNLHGRKYSFVVEELLFRGQVDMLEDASASKGDAKTRREEALAFIATHGWAAYLEKRAIAANVESSQRKTGQKARLVVLHCRNQTFLAALHTPAPAVNLYVGNSLERIRDRLAKSIDASVLSL